MHTGVTALLCSGIIILCHLTVQQSHYPVLPGSHSSTQIVAALLKSLFSQEKFLIHPFFGVRDKTRPGPGLVIKRGLDPDLL